MAQQTKQMGVEETLTSLSDIMVQITSHSALRANPRPGLLPVASTPLAHLST